MYVHHVDRTLVCKETLACKVTNAKKFIGYLYLMCLYSRANKIMLNQMVTLAFKADSSLQLPLPNAEDSNVLWDNLLCDHHNCSKFGC